MKSILVLGSNGMLGSMLTQILSKEFGSVIETNRNGNPLVESNLVIKLDVTSDYNLKTLLDNVNIDYAINAIGVIKQLIKPSDELDVMKAQATNTLFPEKFSEYAADRGIKFIQIGTDCVFSGNKGNYSENDQMDATDVYGSTKRNGEMLSPNSMLIRTSIIGKELKSSNSLLDWVVSQPKGKVIDGYTDHFWNGITTLHFSKIVAGIIQSQSYAVGVQHLVPSNKVSKFELVTEIAKAFGRTDLEIIRKSTGNFTDRTLITLNLRRNLELWNLSGYKVAPSVQELVFELANWTKQ